MSIWPAFETTLERCLGAERFWCDARVAAIGFYQSLGLKPIGREFIKKDKPYIVMERILD